MNLLRTNKSFNCRVSSVLNKDVKQHGKQFLYDGREDTAWSSNEGTPQSITITFEEPQCISGYSFEFQGGFAGRNASVRIEKTNGQTQEEPFYPEDINKIQKFKLISPVTDGCALKVQFQFGDSTDFFGRIIVYNLEVYK